MKRHAYSNYVVALTECDCCKAEVTEVCGGCRQTVCEPCHEHIQCTRCEGSGLQGHGGLLASEAECTWCNGTGEGSL